MLHRAETLALPGPAITGGWPDLAVSETPDGWATEFTSGLLDIDFAHQSRGALGAWLVAEEAPDLLPGIPSTFSNRALVRLAPRADDHRPGIAGPLTGPVARRRRRRRSDGRRAVSKCSSTRSGSR